MTLQIGLTLGILVVAMVLFLTNKISEAAIAVGVSLALCLTKILKPADAFSGFVNTNVILFLAMFVVGGALFETGMAYEIGALVTKFAKTERQLIVAVMMISGIMSAFLSNTGTAAVLMPVVIGIAAKSGFKRSHLLMPLVFGATIGAFGTLLGSPGNLTASATLEEATGAGLAFFDLTVIGLPMLIICAVFMYFWGYKLLPDRDSEEEVTAKDFSNVPKWKKVTSLVVLIITVLAMIFEDKIGIKMYVVACMGALVLVFTGVMTEKQAIDSVSWKTIFLVAGMLPMATALKNTGAGELIAKTVVGWVGENPSPYVLTAVLWLLTCFLTQFMSNSATIVLLSPIGIQIAQQLGANPKAVLIAILAGGSLAFCTPIAQPQNTMVYGPGGYKFKDYFKAGLPLTLICFVICVVLLPIVFPFY